jgi:hypothetical protein
VIRKETARDTSARESAVMEPVLHVNSCVEEHCSAEIISVLQDVIVVFATLA